MKKETLAQVFSSAFCGISKNTLITEHIWMTASDEICLPTQKLETKEQKCIRDFDQTFLFSCYEYFCRSAQQKIAG